MDFSNAVLILRREGGMVTENILPKAAYPYVYANAEIMALQGETEILSGTDILVWFCSLWYIACFNYTIDNLYSFFLSEL